MNFDKSCLVSYYDKYAAARNNSQRENWKCSVRAYYSDFLLKNKVDSILEVGAGTGQDSEFFMKSGFRVTAIDLSPESVLLCKKRGVHALTMDFYNLAFSDHEFGSIYAFNTLFHVPYADFEAVLLELSRVIHPGGYILIGQRGGHSFEGWYNLPGKPEYRFSAVYEMTDYKKLLEKKFQILECHVIPVKNYEFHWFIAKKHVI